MNFWAKITQGATILAIHKTLSFDESKIGVLFYREWHDLMFSLDISGLKIELNL